MHGDFNTVDLIEATVYGCWAFAIVTFMTQLRQIFEDRFATVKDKVVELDWYWLPMKIQRLLPIILIFTQQPLYIACFGSIPCNREALKMVCI